MVKSKCFQLPGTDITIGGGKELFLICGPCVIESRDHSLRLSENIAEIARKVGISLIYKSSFDKANRTSKDSFRGVGLEEGLQILEEIRETQGLPVITDVHSADQVTNVAEVVDVLQIPAFLCRQTDLLLAAARTRKPVMVKKGQMVAPEDMKYAAGKIESADNNQVIFCERGSCFGYRDLIVDFRGIRIMSDLGYPVVFDGTHSVQIMGGASGTSAGRREFIPVLVRAAVAAGVDGIFLECHDVPDKAPSDGPNMIPLEQLQPLLEDAVKLYRLDLETR